MKLLQNPKFTGTALLLLLALNSAMLIFILVRHNGPPHGPEGGPRDFLVHELNFTEQQKNSFDLLIKTHRASVEDLQEKIRVERDSMIGLLENGSVAPSIIKTHADKIGAYQSELENVTFLHFTEVRKICTPEQQKKFDLVIRDALHMMGPAPRK